MMRKLVRAAMLLMAVQAAAAIIGQVLSRKLTRGDESSNEFQVAAFCGGKSFESHAAGLRSGSVITSMGGVEIDLREAALDAAGADLELKVTMGGIQVLVPEHWAVDLSAETMAGECSAHVTDIDELPADAPRLRVFAATRMGGVLVTTKA
ncbi:MAG: cell wall-active antibiotics response protein [bacterium]|nr:cell wall-active antibiotics response protein [bacterium]